MMLSLMFLLLLSGAAAVAIAPFLRTPALQDQKNTRARILERQIAEIESEERQQILTSEEATALRLEAQRRFIASVADENNQETAMPKPQTTIALATAGMVIAGAVTLYAIKGSPDIASVAPRKHPVIAQDASVAAAPVRQVGDIDSMVADLAARLEREPDDADGWRMLGWSYFNMQKHKEAADAYARAVALAPNDASYQSAYGEALVMAGAGYVTDEAKAVFRKTIALDAQNPKARFFLGLAKDQAGDVSGAIEDWIGMVNSAPQGADWAPDLRRRIVERASEAGIDIQGRFSSAPSKMVSPAPRPTTEDVQAAMAMPAADRQAMIEGMVAKLAARLEADPNDPDGWLRLMRSHLVLGRSSQAQADLNSALKVFSSDPDTKARILTEAQSLGLKAN